MKLMTKALQKRFAATQAANHDTKDPLIIAKFFNPAGAGTWYATEYDPEDKIFFGFASIFAGTGTTNGAASAWRNCRSTAARWGWASNGICIGARNELRRCRASWQRAPGSQKQKNRIVRQSVKTP